MKHYIYINFTLIQLLWVCFYLKLTLTAICWCVRIFTQWPDTLLHGGYSHHPALSHGLVLKTCCRHSRPHRWANAPSRLLHSDLPRDRVCMEEKVCTVIQSSEEPFILSGHVPWTAHDLETAVSPCLGCIHGCTLLSNVGELVLVTHQSASTSLRHNCTTPNIPCKPVT